MDVNQFAMETLAVSAISLTLTRAKITDFFRESENMPQLWKNLFRCPYCMSHWLALPSALHHSRWGEYWFALVGSAAIVMGVIQRLWLWQETRIHTLEKDLDDATERLKEVVGYSPNILHD